MQARKFARVRDSSRSDGGRVDVADSGPFPTGELDLDSEAFYRGAVFLHGLLKHKVVSN